MNLELHCIKQKTSAFIRAYIGYYPIIPTNKKLLLKMTSVLPVRLVLFRVGNQIFKKNQTKSEIRTPEKQAKALFLLEK